MPIALAALAVIQRTLHLPPRARRRVSIDYLGALLISGGVASILIWVSLAGHAFDWWSAQTVAMVLGGAALLALAILVEARSREPLIPLGLFRNRTLVLSVIAAAAVGVALFGTAVFLSQYLQIARGESPTASGLLTIPMVLGTLFSSTVIGQVITRTGRYKRWMMLGAALMTVGLGLMGGLLDEHTSLIELGCFMALVGLGVGMVMQNLVLVVQNSVSSDQIGASSSLVAFFRSLGGAAGVSALGAVLGAQASASVAGGLAARGIAPGGGGGAGGGQVPDPGALPEPVRAVVEHAYGLATADIFMVAAPLGLVALIAIALLDETPLGTTSGAEHARLRQAAAPGREQAPAPVPG